MPRILDPGFVFEDDDSRPLSAGTVTFYRTGTVTLKNTYADASLTTLNANPMTLDIDGRLPTEAFGTGLYTIRAADVNGATIWSRDDIGEDIYAEGSATRTLQEKASDIVSVKDYGAVGDGITSDSTAIQAALDSGSTSVFLPSGTYLISAVLTIPADTTLFGRATLKKNANTDMVTMASRAHLEDVALDGSGATYTGRGIVISAGIDQKLTHVSITDMNGLCLEFSANVGSGFEATNCLFDRRTSTNPGISFASTAETTGGRRFVGCRSSGILMQTLGGLRTSLIGCSTTTLTMSQLTSKLVMSGCQLSSDLAIDGTDCSITGNILYGNVTFASTSQNVTFSGNEQNITSSIIDNSTANYSNWIWDEYVDLTGTYAPTWVASTTAPVLGNAVLDGRYIRSGKCVTIRLTLTMGSTTTYGTGTYSFTLPTPLNRIVLDDSVGHLYALDSSASANFAGIVRVAGGAAPAFTLYSTGVAQWGTAVPFTWASGDVLKFMIQYEIV